MTIFDQHTKIMIQCVKELTQCFIICIQTVFIHMKHSKTNTTDLAGLIVKGILPPIFSK